MKFIHGEDWKQKIARQERVTRGVSARLRSRYDGHAVSPLTDEERRAVDDATRYEQFRNFVHVIKGSKVPKPYHKSCQ
ncbi:MAG TPA: hypothetical protein VF297_05345 [Pyrinomonadaceae bacterium]